MVLLRDLMSVAVFGESEMPLSMMILDKRKFEMESEVWTSIIEKRAADARNYSEEEWRERLLNLRKLDYQSPPN